MFAAMTIRRILVAGGLALFVHEGVAQTQDNVQSITGDSAMLSGAPGTQTNAENSSCIEFGNPKQTNGFFKYQIRKPGRYCLTEDLHARTELPGPEPRLAESAMIVIWTSNVVLDLQGHTLGRGRIFKNPGGVGIVIRDAVNIYIRNGVLQDFGAGIIARRWDDVLHDTPVVDTKGNAYRFPANNIVLENITFKNIEKNFDIWIPSPPRPPDPAAERRRKSQLFPCGGSDDFGRPLPPGTPCDDVK